MKRTICDRLSLTSIQIRSPIRQRCRKPACQIGVLKARFATALRRRLARDRGSPTCSSGADPIGARSTAILAEKIASFSFSQKAICQAMEICSASSRQHARIDELHSRIGCQPIFDALFPRSPGRHHAANLPACALRGYDLRNPRSIIGHGAFDRKGAGVVVHQDQKEWVFLSHRSRSFSRLTITTLAGMIP